VREKNERGEKKKREKVREREEGNIKKK